MGCPIGTDVERAAELFNRGGLVAFATETVYGLGANALDPQAVARIFEAKERPFFDPLIVHVADTIWLSRLVRRLPPEAQRLIDRFWPGPLTLVLPKQNIVPDIVTAGLSTVAVRMPAHPIALEFLRRTNAPAAAPSANLFGRVSPTTALHVAEQLGERIEYILDGGASAIGLESTVLDLSLETPRLLRPGGLSVEQIEETIGRVQIVETTATDVRPQVAPGMSAKHYATRTRLIVASQEASLPSEEQIGLLAFTPEPMSNRFTAVEVLSPRGDVREAASNLFAAMRRLDSLGLDVIVARPVPDHGLGRAINNRLARAAAMTESR
jgi:L-threonylcarbamoyladenylate synthase